MTEHNDRIPSSPFHHAGFTAIWTANLASHFGTLIQMVGAAWLMATLTSSPVMIALVQASNSLPIMILGLFAGATADNYNRYNIMIIAQAFMLCTALLLATLIWMGFLTPLMLLILVFLNGCGQAFTGPAWHASVGDLVPKALIRSAVAYNSMAFNMARSLGPAIGGAIVAIAGAATAFIINAVSYLGLILVLFHWRSNAADTTSTREQLFSAISDGLRYAIMSPRLLSIYIRAFLFASAAGALPALMPVVARDVMDGDAITYGVLLGAFGVGSVAGAFITARLRDRFSTEWIVRMASLALAIGTVAAGLSTHLLLSLPMLMFAGAGWVGGLSTMNASIQLGSPRWVVARTISIYQVFAFGAMALGSWLFGWAAQEWNVSTALLLAAGWQVAGIFIGIRLPMPIVDRLDMDPLRLWQEPQIAFPIHASSGPVRVAIRYRIAEKDVSRFLKVMNERRRIRRRDGARHWVLLRDLNDPLAWTERYQTATWADYVRHNQRRTMEDSRNIAALRDFHIGPAPPDLQLMLDTPPNTQTIAGDLYGRTDAVH